MNVLLFARYGRLGASSRVRSYQYLSYLESQGIHVTASCLLGDDYLTARYAGGRPHPARVASAYAARLRTLVRARRYDLVWIEKELFPWLPSWGESLLRTLAIPYVVEYDDAIFHRYDQNPRAWIRCLLGAKVDRIMRGATAVIAGNDYLAERARHARARRIDVIPSAVDCRIYTMLQKPPNDPPVIGWIGTPITFEYVVQIQNALAEVCRQGRARLVLVGADPRAVTDIEAEVRPWSEKTEVADVQSFDIGIMPLDDGLWEKGKCGYKLVQYMACGRPVVASPIGVNRSIVTDGENGFMASRREEWVATLSALRDDPELRRRMGAAGRKKVEAEFCTRVTGPRLAGVLRASASG